MIQGDWGYINLELELINEISSQLSLVITLYSSL